MDNLGILEKTIHQLKLIFKIIVIAASIAGLGLFCWVIVVLIGATPEVYLTRWLDIITAFGGLFAGLGAIFLAYYAYFAFGEWKVQLSTKSLAALYLSVLLKYSPVSPISSIY
jgi:hypothetical protein